MSVRHVVSVILVGVGLGAVSGGASLAFGLGWGLLTLGVFLVVAGFLLGWDR
jgi:hypothetical protein